MITWKYSSGIQSESHFSFCFPEYHFHFTFFQNPRPQSGFLRLNLHCHPPLLWPSHITVGHSLPLVETFPRLGCPRPLRRRNVFAPRTAWPTCTRRPMPAFPCDGTPNLFCERRSARRNVSPSLRCSQLPRGGNVSASRGRGRELPLPGRAAALPQHPLRCPVPGNVSASLP